MDNDYTKAVVSAAQQKIKNSNKPLSEAELVRGIVHLLKKKIGKKDSRHSSKIRFKKEIFSKVVKSDFWKDTVIELGDGKFRLKADYPIVEMPQVDSEYSFKEQPSIEAISATLKLLKKLNDYKFEDLCCEISKKIHPYHFEVTKRSGDMGVDVIGTRNDPSVPDKIEVMYIQAKKYSKSVGRGFADAFIGTVNTFLNNGNKKFSKVTAIFMTTGIYPDSFAKQLSDASKPGLCFYAWDGVQLAEQLVKEGMGVKYSIDIDFWDRIDPTLFSKEKVTSTGNPSN